MKPYIKLATLFTLVLFGFLLYVVFPINEDELVIENSFTHPQQPPPPPSHFVPPPPVAVPIEALLKPYPHFQSQPLKQPKPYLPASQPSSSIPLDTLAPTADEITIRLNGAQALSYAKPNEVWQFSVINTKPDVFIATEGHVVDINNHYEREYRIYSLMKWILRVHRRDSLRKDPLLMVDVGSNHGLFTLVAGASGAHAIAFEPQTPLQSVINLACRLNSISDRVRILPFAALDKFREISMSNYRSGDGGVGFLDFNAKDSIIKTQTIRIDSIPSFSRLFAASKKVSSVRTKQDIGKDYAAILEINNLKDIPTTLDKAMVLRQPIHFMKIDVEGFELKSLESASGLYEAGLVEHTVLEFGPPSRWDVTLESTTGMSVEEKRATTTAQAKRILLKAMREWHLDIYLLPAIGWESTVRWMLDHGVDYSQNISSTSQSKSNKVVYQLMAWDFDGMGMESDEFEDELKAKDQMVTEFIPLPENLLEAYLDDLESIGEMYLWFAKRGSKSPVLAKTTL